MQGGERHQLLSQGLQHPGPNDVHDLQSIEPNLPMSPPPRSAQQRTAPSRPWLRRAGSVLRGASAIMRGQIIGQVLDDGDCNAGGAACWKVHRLRYYGWLAAER